MEVEAVQVNDQVNCFVRQTDKQSITPDHSDVYDVFGDPNKSPRVGKQYQAEIPALMSVADYYCTFNVHQVGLHIPLMWIKEEVENNKHDPLKHACNSVGVTNESEFSILECTKETQNSLEHEQLNPEPKAIDTTVVNGMELIECGNSNVQQETKIGKGYCLVPESSSAPWNQIEEASFTLGLYIFGKNFVQVERFVDNKKRGDILSFYYGKFHKSKAYRRWYDCRKIRSRKCIHGQRIFTGPKQQEFFSRLLANVSEECRSKLLEVSRTFVDGRMLLEDYVLTLKASVGLKALVEAVGIGKGKEDLTGLAADSMKSTQGPPVRQEIPVSKDFSGLTPAEIISFLTGNFRLSKIKSSGLFWEAVWPRLLARGWHSEQPGSDKCAAASKHPLLFLVPGVIKFSRKLVRGNHYFDSISDVLSKVASDPTLIELETVANNDCTSKEENGRTKETKLDRENSPDQQLPCYLTPRTPNGSTDEMKFTIVDTSLRGGKVRELRSLPDGVAKASTFEYDSDNEDNSEEQTNEVEVVDNMCFDWGKIDDTNASKFVTAKGVSSDMNGIENNPSKEVLPTRSIGSTNPSAASKYKKTDLLSNTQRRDAMKGQSIQRVEPDSTNVVVPFPKRPRRLKTCSRADRYLNNASIFMVPGKKQEDSEPTENVAANIIVAPRAKQEKASNCLLNSKLSEDVPSQETPAEEKKLLASLLPHENKTLEDPLSIPSSNIIREAVPVTSSSGTKDQHEKLQPRTIIIDLNLPVSPEVDAHEPFLTEVAERQQNNSVKESDDPSVEIICKPVDHSEHQPEVNSRRKSTRTTQPTIRVLEALASGCLVTKEKRRRRDYLQDNLMSKTPRSTRPKVAGETSHDGMADIKNEERANVECDGSGHGNSNSNVICTGFTSSEG